MSTTKKVLFVDDNFETIDFFRSMLDLMDNRFVVTSAPSAEEAWLEFAQNEFDLLITDLRLPGMSGIELIKRAHKKRPGFPTILISGYERDQVKAELEEVEITTYLEKPYEASELLGIMQLEMFGEVKGRKDKENDSASTAQAAPPEIEFTLNREAEEALSSLSFYTGGDQVLLGLLSGQILHQLVPSNQHNLSVLGPWMGRIIAAGNYIGEEIGNGQPHSIYHLEVDDQIIFLTGVGKRYFVALFLDNRSERGRLGVLWVAVQRISKDLTPLLPDVNLPIDALPTAANAKPEPTNVRSAATRPVAQRTTPTPKPKKAEPQPEPEIPPLEPEFVPLTEPVIDNNALTGLLEDDSLWKSDTNIELNFDESILTQTDSPSGGTNSLSYEDAIQRGILEPPPPAVEPERKINTGMLMSLIESAAESEPEEKAEDPSNKYWVDATQSDEVDPNNPNRDFLSLEDAINQGLLGKNFGKESEE